MADLARTTFQQVLGESPAVYLDPGFQDVQVTLELLAEIYQQARLAGVETDVKEPTPAWLFEHLRPRIGKDRLPGGMFSSVRRKKDALMSNLKYLMACLEEVNRILGFELRIKNAIDHNYSFQQMEGLIQPMRKKVKVPAESAREVHVLAYAFA
jgi:hypothetical protein